MGSTFVAADVILGPAGLRPAPQEIVLCSCGACARLRCVSLAARNFGELFPQVLAESVADPAHSYLIIGQLGGDLYPRTT